MRQATQLWPSGVQPYSYAAFKNSNNKNQSNKTQLPFEQDAAAAAVL